jgi:DNA-binding response OmpR family regulator
MKSILLIEHNADILANLVEYFELEGYHVISADTGKKGIAMAIQFIPDLIICDTPKPGIDGEEVLKLLLNNIYTLAIPFIFCTAICEKNSRQQALEQGADDFIIKPFQLEYMLERATACISTGSKRQRNLA